jgi:predicted PurR-regulated permease PerM
MDSRSPPTVLQAGLADNVANVAAFLIANAARARTIGNICVGATLFIGIIILGVFLVYGQFVSELQIRQSFDLAKSRAEEQKALFNSLSNELERVRASNEERQQMFDAIVKAESNRPTTALADQVLSSITGSVVRVGAVLIGIYLIQIMVTFARYYYKLAEHLSMAAALINLSKGKVADLKTLSPLLLPSTIDFGKAPSSPI